MAAFHHTVFIARPIETVFAAVADVRTHPHWQAGLLQTEAELESSDRCWHARGRSAKAVWAHSALSV